VRLDRNPGLTISLTNMVFSRENIWPFGALAFPNCFKRQGFACPQSPSDKRPLKFRDRRSHAKSANILFSARHQFSQRHRSPPRWNKCFDRFDAAWCSLPSFYSLRFSLVLPFFALLLVKQVRHLLQTSNFKFFFLPLFTIVVTVTVIIQIPPFADRIFSSKMPSKYHPVGDEKFHDVSPTRASLSESFTSTLLEQEDNTRSQEPRRQFCVRWMWLIHVLLLSLSFCLFVSAYFTRVSTLTYVQHYSAWCMQKPNEFLNMCTDSS